MRLKATSGRWMTALTAITLVSTASLAAVSDRSVLIQAVKNADKEIVRSLVAQDVDVNGRLPDGATALHWAVHLDDLEMADLLIGAGAEVNVTNDYGVMPLSLACTNGSAAMVRRLLTAGADPNAKRPTDETPLMTAARTGKVDAVKALLEHRADVGAAENSRGETALMWAAGEGHADVVRLLAEHGADVRAPSKTGFTPLLFAAQRADRETMRVLLDAGASVNEPASDGVTALIIASSRRHTAFAEFLLGLGADPNAGPGYTAMHVVAPQSPGMISADGGPHKLDFVKLLLAFGADVNARAKRAPRGVGTQGATPFFLAARVADVALMRLLVNSGADPQIPTIHGTTALMTAAGILGHVGGEVEIFEEQALQAVKTCVKLGLDVNAANVSHGDTALHGAAYRGREGGASIVQFLVDNGANVNVINKRRYTPLLIAEGLYTSNDSSKNDETAALLRKLGAPPSPPGFNRNTGIRGSEFWYEPGKEPATLGLPERDR